jgi:thioredoxin-dependent peroxiredoxin
MLTRPWTCSLTPIALLGLALAAGPADAQDTALAVGDRAPVFEAIADDGQLWRSRDHVGKGLLVIYFYPAAMTSGCTAQACSFRDNRSRLQELGAEVVGVSGDRVDGLRAFKGSNRLNFPLLSDTAGTVARAFGVPVRKGGSMTRTVDGREVELRRDVTAARWTFIIGRDGRIAYRDTQVDPAGDGDAVLAALRRLRRSGGQE